MSGIQEAGSQFAGLLAEASQLPLLCSLQVAPTGADSSAAYQQTPRWSYEPETRDTSDLWALTLVFNIKDMLDCFPSPRIMLDQLQVQQPVCWCCYQQVCISSQLIDRAFLQADTLQGHSSYDCEINLWAQLLVIHFFCLQAQLWLTKFPCMGAGSCSLLKWQAQAADQDLSRENLFNVQTSLKDGFTAIWALCWALSALQRSLCILLPIL